MSPSHCIPATNSLREKLGSPPVTVTPTPTLSASRSTAKVAMVPRLIQLSIPSLSPPELFLPCRPSPRARSRIVRSEEHTSELQSRVDLVCRLLLEKKKNKQIKRKT